MIALIDGDVLVYRIGFATETEPEGLAIARMATYLESILFEHLDVAAYEGYLTGSGNFRDEIAVTAPYKGNRDAAPKPRHYDILREYLVKSWRFEVIDGQEADDELGIRATYYAERNEDPIIVTTDKDLKMIPCRHFNPVTKKKFLQSPEGGLLHFYCQILAGDRVDNIIGLRGVGMVTAEKILKGCDDEVGMFLVCCAAYDSVERVIENGRLLWMRRERDQIWQPPI